jgi:aspartate/methionine/tyrosine aminotransferase
MPQNTTPEIGTETVDGFLQGTTERLTSEQLRSLSQNLAGYEERLSLFCRLTGAYELSVAENVLIFDYFKGSLQDWKTFDVKDTKYAQPYFGDAGLRKGVADLLQGVMKHPDGLAADHLTGVSGTSAALECLAFALFKPGDVAIIPSPRWQGFAWCFEQRRGMKIQGVAPEVDAIKKACEKLGKDTRFALVLTNPDNPTGNHYPKVFLEEVYSHVLRNYPKAHIISDELYCFSQIGRAGRVAFVSGFALDAYRNLDRDRVHVVWGFAKDFGLSGLKAGFVITANECVHAAIRDAPKDSPCRARSGWFSPFDSLKSFAFKRLFAARGGNLPKLAMDEYRERLSSGYDEIAKELRGAGIRFNESSGAQFFWLDLREFLDRVPVVSTEHHLDPEILALLDLPPGDNAAAGSWDREQKLLKYLADGNGGRGVALLPGQTLAAGEEGFFRLCFTCEAPGVMTNAVKRLIDLLKKLPKT